MLDRRTGEVRDVIPRGTYPRYASTGHLLYGVESTVYAVRFDADRLEVEGDPVPLVEGVAAGGTGAMAFDVSEGGSLVYIPGEIASAQNRVLALVGRDGGVDPLPLAAAAYRSPRLSPDGERLAFEIEGESNVVLTYDLSRETAAQRLAFDGNNYRPVWTPDGERIAFASDREGPISIYWQNSNGSGVADRLTTAEEGTAHWPEAFSPNGETLVYRLERPIGSLGWSNEGNEMDLWMVSLDALDSPEPVAAEPPPIMEFGAHFSPGGEWLAYTVGLRPASENYEVWARPFPITEERRRVSGGAGVVPLWSRLGDELFYRPVTALGGSIQPLRSVRVFNEPFSFGVEEELDIRNLLSLAYHRNFDVMPNGQDFVIVMAGGSAASDPAVETPRQVIIVLDWFEELRERVPVP